MAYPTLSHGGTPIVRLITPLEDAIENARVLEEALHLTQPNGRDYVSEDHFEQAQREHRRRLTWLAAITEELEGSLQSVREQYQARERQRR